MHDLVIRGGTVADGTGAPTRVADVAVDGGLITAVGEVAAKGRRDTKDVKVFGAHLEAVQPHGLAETGQVPFRAVGSRNRLKLR